MPPLEWRRVLAIRLDNAGDVVMLGPALRSLRAALPSAHITLLTSPAGAAAAPLLPDVDHIVRWRASWQQLGGADADRRTEWQLVALLEEGEYDAALVFTSFSQTPHVAAYVCLLAGIPERVGASKEWAGAVLTTAVPPPPDDVHQVDRNLGLVEALGLPVTGTRLSVEIPVTARKRAGQLLAEARLASGGYLVVNPWTTCSARTYPPDRMAAAVRGIAGQTGLPAVILGHPRDRNRSRGFAEEVACGVIDLTGRTSLLQATAIVDEARLVLTNNTSVMHLADATSTPQVVLFSGTERRGEWEPRGGHSTLLGVPTPCTPCRRFDCDIGLLCLDVPPADVVEAGLSLLESSS